MRIIYPYVFEKFEYGVVSWVTSIFKVHVYCQTCFKRMWSP